MTLHLIKLCVGVERIDELRRWQARRLAQSGRTVHQTRQRPRRQDELLDGGSLYWVIKGQIRVRQRLIGLERIMVGDGRSSTLLVLDPTLVCTLPTPHRPFQGWRYLEPRAAPPDLEVDCEDTSDVPLEMLAELRELGLL